MVFETSFKSFNDKLNKQIEMSGMTFDPSVDCRNDLVNFYGYTREQVNSMSDDELFSIMDEVEANEKGYSLEEEEEQLPAEIAHNKCSCGGNLKVLFVDCETRGDCEIYVCECVSCGKDNNLNYAAEWFDGWEPEEEEEVHSIEVFQEEPVKVIEIDTRSIDDLDLSVRTYNCLTRSGHKSVQEIKEMSLNDVCRIRNFGRRSMIELEEVLNIKFN